MTRAICQKMLANRKKKRARKTEVCKCKTTWGFARFILVALNVNVFKHLISWSHYFRQTIGVTMLQLKMQEKVPY